MRKDDHNPGFINAHEAYSKLEVMRRLKISQKSWDKMLNEGLAYSSVGKGKWVTGEELIDFLKRNSEQRNGT